jgi:cyclic pyranopterin phosphate synthase
MVKIFRFEGIGSDLALLPLSARRALDGAGIKISLTAWLSMSLSTRRALVRAGSASVVDAEQVAKAIARAAVPHAPIERVAENGLMVPAELKDLLSDQEWRDLEPIGRYALAKVAKKGGERLQLALVEIAKRPASWSNHLAPDGTVRMVNVGDKATTARRAVARAKVVMKPSTIELLRRGDTPKGDALATARIAGIQAAKRTSELIPLCHAVALTRVDITIDLQPDGVNIDATAEARDRTGVEMEAMVAASTAALTLYDMLKGIDRGITFSVRLHMKTGGKRGTWVRDEKGEGS